MHTPAARTRRPRAASITGLALAAALTWGAAACGDDDGGGETPDPTNPVAEVSTTTSSIPGSSTTPNAPSTGIPGGPPSSGIPGGVVEPGSDSGGVTEEGPATTGLPTDRD